MDVVDDTIPYWPFDKQNIMKKILGYLDYECLRHAEDVCLSWKKIIADEKLWEKLLQRNVQQIPDWGKMEQVLRLRNSAIFLLPFKDSFEYQKEVCCQIGDSIKKLKSNWTNGINTGTNYSFNTTPTKARENKPIHLSSMNQRWIIRVSPNGRISTRNRWAPEEEHVAKLLPDKRIPIDDAERHPIIESVQFNDELFAAVGVVGTRTIVFIFEVKEHEAESPLLKCVAWRKIEDTAATDHVYNFDSKNCIRLKGDLLLLCGRKIADQSTVVTLMNVKELRTIYKHKEVTSRVGQLTDFAVDDWCVVLLFGRKETPRAPRMNRYMLQIRDTASFEFLQSFVLPIIHSDVCRFDYSRGFVVTGSDDSRVRIWNVSEGTCDGDFKHGYKTLSSLKIVADRLILTCDGGGIVKLWRLDAAMNPETRDDPSSVLLKTLDAPLPPYSTFRQVKCLAMQADEFQIALVLQYDTKSPTLYVMDFFAEDEMNENGCTTKMRRNRKRRLV